ncbi:DUF924 family protein [uncultured Sphingorhabdus sp.]|uniref:DUF924 family protein n=1 Tax=uncultured Sphingorhabdus sp. TaxID=1686106 RepID=UPI00260B227B|nr:DUF924 family protein [uncultured Sphingorhabdus sp.]HMS19009.1 DUF924 family protein [Sphingorhabdus sp.]
MIEDDEAETVAPPPDWAEQLLRFWFVEHGFADWFKGGDAFDVAVTKGFAAWRDALRELPTESFLTDPHTALAAVILFDQAPRNAYRGHAEAFATDHLALAIAKAAIAGAFDTSLSKDERLFLYLPFEHSENRDDQRESVRLVSQLGDQGLLKYAKDHQAMIERFGRFPHRNKALGRTDRPGEAEAVAAGNNW